MTITTGEKVAIGFGIAAVATIVIAAVAARRPAVAAKPPAGAAAGAVPPPAGGATSDMGNLPVQGLPANIGPVTDATTRTMTPGDMGTIVIPGLPAPGGMFVPGAQILLKAPNMVGGDRINSVQSSNEDVLSPMGKSGPSVKMAPIGVGTAVLTMSWTKSGAAQQSKLTVVAKQAPQPVD